MKQILIVEDDRNLNNGIKLALRSAYICQQAFSPEEAWELYDRNHPDLIILDVNFPGGNGLDLLTRIRSVSKVPVILLTANKLEMDIVAGLELGANDYITKPFSLMILRARVGVQLREDNLSGDIYRIGDFFFDFVRMEFSKGGENLELSKTEQRLLRCFVENRGKNLSRSLLIDTVWQGETEFVDEHALTVAVNRLRNKLGDNPSHPQWIKTVYGVGYTWESR